MCYKSSIIYASLIFVTAGFISYLTLNVGEQPKDNPAITRNTFNERSSINERRLNPDAKASRSQLLQEKQAFCDARGLNLQDEEHMVLDARTPTVRFWINRLFDTDPEKRKEAFDKFSTAARFGEAGTVPEGVDDDTMLIWRVGSANFSKIKQAEQFSSFSGSRNPNFYRLLGYQADILLLVKAHAERLQDPSLRLDAQRVLNYYTMNIYEDKDDGWWENEFANSKLAGIFVGLRKEE